MRALCFPAGQDASAHFRLREPARALAAQGADARASDTAWLVRSDDHTGRVLEVQPPDCDVVVLQRVQGRRVVESIPHLQASGVAVVVDLDDDLERVHPRNAAYGALNYGADRNWRWAEEACKLADMVTVTTPALAERYGGHGRVRVVPNRIPAAELGAPREHDGLRVGWPAAVTTHPNDLQALGGSVAEVLGRRGLPFYVVGPGGGVGEQLGYEKVLTSGSLTYDAWLTGVRTLDAGVVPLASTAFNRAKSCLKVLQLASNGVPAVASPTPDNERAAASGCCLVARRPREWRAELSRLLDNPGYREERAGRAYAGALEHVLEDHAVEWWDAWAAALAHRRKSA